MDRDFLEAFGLTVVIGALFGLLLRLLDRTAEKARTGNVIDDNAARRLYGAFKLAGLWWVTTSIVHSAITGEDVVVDLLDALMWTTAAFSLYIVAGQLGVALLFGRTLPKEVDEGNVAAAVAAGAHHIAMALLVAEACEVEVAQKGALGTSIVFFVLAVLAQQLVIVLFRALTVYDDAEQIAGENMAAAISYAGTTVAAAIVLARAIEGEIGDDIKGALLGFVEVALLAVLLLPVRQLLTAGLLLRARPRMRGGALDDAIVLRHDSATAALAAAVAITIGTALARLA